MRYRLACRAGLISLSVVATALSLATTGCGGNTATTDTVDLTFTGAIDQGTESLGFELPAMKSSEVQTLQLEEEELLGTVTLTGEDAPEVHAHGTTRVPIRFDIVGMGEFEATRWVVTITKQGSTPPADTFEKEASLAGRERAYLVFTGLSEGRWDTTLRLYGIRHGKAGSLLAQVSPPTTIDAEPRLLDFDATKTALTVHVDAASPPGVGDVAWTAATATPWLSVSPESGTGSGDITVTVDRTGLAAGIYTDGAITVTSGGIPMNVDVAMEVSAAKIAFVTDRDGNYEIYVANADGSGQTRLTNTPGNDELLPRWSPDRSKILFVRGDRLYTMDPDGSGQAMLIDVMLSSADWSPDGTQIAANGERSGINDIAIVEADGSGLEAADQRPVSLDRHAQRLEQGRPAGQQGDVRRRAAHVQDDAVSAGAVREAQDPHDACRRSREDGLHGLFGRPADFEGASVGLEDVDGGGNPRAGRKLEDLPHELLVQVEDRGVQEGRGDAPAKVEIARQAMAEGDVPEAVADEFADLVFVCRISGAELAHDAQVCDARRLEIRCRRLDLALLDRGDLDAPVAHIPRDEARVLADPKVLGREARAACHDHPDTGRLALDDGVGGQGGAEDDALDGCRVLVAQDLVHHADERRDEAELVRGDLGLLSDLEILEEDGIRVGAPDVNAEDHATSFGEGRRAKG